MATPVKHVNKIEEIGQFKYPNRSIQDKSYKKHPLTESGAHKIPNDEKSFYSHPPAKIMNPPTKRGGKKSRKTRKTKKTRRVKRKSIKKNVITRKRILRKSVKSVKK